MRSMRLLAACGLGVALAWLCLGVLAPTRAATFTVTKTADTNDGSCDLGDCSLREAIVAANANADPDTISLGSGTFLLSIAGVNENACATGDLDVTNPLTIAGSGAEATIIDAQGIDRVLDLRYAAGTVVISGVTLQHGVLSGTTSDRGAGLYSDRNTVRLVNTLVFSNRTRGGTSDLGAGIYCRQTHLTLADSRVLSNVADYNGGGLYIDAASTVTPTGASRLAHNQAKNGGGVYLHDGTLALCAGEVAENVAATDGGGIFDWQGTLLICGGRVVSNAAASGGGVRLTSGAALTQTGASSLIAYNQATWWGGGVYMAAGAAAALAAGQVLSNSAWIGGGVYMLGGNLTLQGAQVLSNQAGSEGGGIALMNHDARLTMAGAASRVGHNSTQGTGGGVDVSYGLAQISGGLIWDNAAASGAGLDVGDAGVTMNGGLIFSNTATSMGGGVYVGQGVFTQTGTASIRQNHAVNDGGGLYISSGDARLLGGSILDNDASRDGGGVYALGLGGVPAVLWLAGGDVLSNTATGYGGGVYLSSATVAMTQTAASLVAHNTAAVDGGGIANISANAWIAGGIVQENVAQRGGGMFVSSGQVFLNDAQIVSNTVTFSGGGVFMQGWPSILTQTGASLVAANVAGNAGGGYFADGGNVRIFAGTVSRNQATEGGAVFVNSGDLRLEGGRLAANTADRGGGVYIRDWAGTMFLSNPAQIDHNQADVGAGGGIFLGDGTLTGAGGRISENEANTLGGGLYVLQGEASMSGIHFFTNTAAITGGAIYNAATGVVTVTESCILANSDTAAVNNGGQFSAGDNWWGEANGPGGAGPGDGDSVSAGVDYGAWKTSPLPGCGNVALCLPVTVRDD